MARSSSGPDTVLDGGATVEKIAINAVMAGCLPEHMPVLIAAVLGMADPRFNMRSVAEHAKIIADHGWSKQDIKEYMCHHSLIEWRYLKYGGILYPETINPAWKWLLDAPEDTLLPIVANPDWFHIAVVGGAVGKSAYLTGVGAPVTVETKR